VTTERLRLTAPTAADVDELDALHADPAVWQDFPSRRSEPPRRVRRLRSLGRMESMSGSRGRQYPAELRERAVRLVGESRPEHASEWEAMRSVATKLGVGSTETVRTWVRRAEVEAVTREPVTVTESAEVRKLRTENRELRRANDILKVGRLGFRGSAQRFRPV